MTTRPVLAELGDWLSVVKPGDLPTVARDTAKRSILDLLGVSLAASTSSVASMISRYIGAAAGEGPPGGHATVLGLGTRAGIETAAFANGALGHALDFDDVSHTMGGHPSVPVLPAALAIAEARHQTGDELLLAFAVGVEVETAIARGVNFVHYDKGWHPTATLGTFGAAAAAAKILGLDAERATVALSLATAFAAGLKSSFGTSAKSLQVGRAAQSGVTCALLAASGATAKSDAFESPQGFATVFNGIGAFDLAKVTDRLARPWDLEDPGIAIKLHPCCGGTHAAVDAALAVRREIANPADIVSIEAAVHPRRFAHLDRPSVVDDPLEAKFSLQYSVALALLNGRIAISDYTAENLVKPELARLVLKVHGAPLPERSWGSEHFAGEVRVVLADGTEHFSRFERPRGRTSETALTAADIDTKFAAGTEHLLSVQAQNEVIFAVNYLEDLLDVATLTESLSGSRGGAGVSPSSHEAKR